MPGGCDIFDPFQAQDNHAPLGLTPGDIYWRTREKVQVGGECKYLIAACTPCCDLRGAVLGSHEFGGIMLKATPDIITGDVILFSEVPPVPVCECQVLTWGIYQFPCELIVRMPLEISHVNPTTGEVYATGRLARKSGEWRTAPLGKIQAYCYFTLGASYSGTGYRPTIRALTDRLGSFWPGDVLFGDTRIAPRDHFVLWLEVLLTQTRRTPLEGIRGIAYGAIQSNAQRQVQPTDMALDWQLVNWRLSGDQPIVAPSGYDPDTLDTVSTGHYEVTFPQYSLSEVIVYAQETELPPGWEFI